MEVIKIEPEKETEIEPEKDFVGVTENADILDNNLIAEYHAACKRYPETGGFNPTNIFTQAVVWTVNAEAARNTPYGKKHGETEKSPEQAVQDHGELLHSYDAPIIDLPVAKETLRDVKELVKTKVFPGIKGKAWQQLFIQSLEDFESLTTRHFAYPMIWILKDASDFYGYELLGMLREIADVAWKMRHRVSLSADFPIWGEVKTTKLDIPTALMPGEETPIATTPTAVTAQATPEPKKGLLDKLRGKR